jgi:hypothetical protein
MGADHAHADARAGRLGRGFAVAQARFGGGAVGRGDERGPALVGRLHSQVGGVQALLGVVHLGFGGGLASLKPDQRVVIAPGVLPGQAGLVSGAGDLGQVGGAAAPLDELQLRSRGRNARLGGGEIGARVGGVDFHQGLIAGDRLALLHQDARGRAGALGAGQGPLDRLGLSIGRDGAGDGLARGPGESHRGRLVAPLQQPPGPHGHGRQHHQQDDPGAGFQSVCLEE